MEDILTCTMGLDVHRDVIVACLIKGELNQKPEIEIRNFSTLRPDMEILKKCGLERAHIKRASKIKAKVKTEKGIAKV